MDNAMIMGRMSTVDIWILSTALVSTVLFYMMHIVIFRYVDEHEVIKHIINTFCLATLLHLVIHLVFITSFYEEVRLITFTTKILCIGLSFTLYGICSFLYILIIFGPNETSIRVRILREIYQAPGHHLSKDDLLHRYNNKIIIRRRLERLLHSEELRFDGISYSIVNRQSMFKIIDILASSLDRLMRGPKHKKG